MFGPIKRKVTEKLKDIDEKHREQEETAKVYAEFVKSFEGSDEDATKTFVRTGVVQHGGASSTTGTTLPTVYKPPPIPKPRGESSEVSGGGGDPKERQRATSSVGGGPAASGDAREVAVPLFNTGVSLRTSKVERTREIDSFLQEIKQKQQLKQQLSANASASPEEKQRARQQLEEMEAGTRTRGSIPGIVEAEETTNLYIGNLSPEVTEEYLCSQFGKYGTITSVKIMYPRTDEEKFRGRNCGFVSFECRAMAQVAKDAIDGTTLYGMPIRIGWGKAIMRPTSVGGGTPVPALGTVKCGGFSDEPLPSSVNPAELGSARDQTNRKADVVVELPADKRVKELIDTLAVYVAEDGHAFEQHILQEQRHNEKFRFMFDQTTKLHTYYRWRVFALAQGDTMKAWRQEPFPVYIGGPMWIPPPGSSNLLDPTSLVPTDCVESPRGSLLRRRDARGPLSGGLRLSNDDRDELEEILRGLTPLRSSICTAMVFCLDLSESALEISECITESLTIEATPYKMKLVRLYLLSDILYNSSSTKPAAWAYRTAFEKLLPEIFEHLGTMYRAIDARITASQMRDQLMSLIRIWENWAIYSPRFTKGLEASLLGGNINIDASVSDTVAPIVLEQESENPYDGTPIEQFESLSIFPYWLRHSVLEWARLGSSQLERVTQLHAMSSSLFVESCSQRPESLSQLAQRAVSVGSAAPVRGSKDFFLRTCYIHKLLLYEIYEKEKIDSENRQLEAFLGTEGSRELRFNSGESPERISSDQWEGVGGIGLGGVNEVSSDAVGVAAQFNEIQKRGDEDIFANSHGPSASAVPPQCQQDIIVGHS